MLKQDKKSKRTRASAQMYRVGAYALLFLFALLTTHSVPYAILFLPLAFICIILATQIREPKFGIADCALLCFYLFFCISPMQRMTSHGLFSRSIIHRTISLTDTLLAELLIAVFAISFVAGVVLVQKSMAQYRFVCDFDKKKLSSYSLIFFVICILAVGTFIITSGGIQDLLRPRRMKENSLAGTPIPVLFLGLALLSSISQIAALKQQARKSAFTLFLLAIQLGLLMLCVNPLNQSRFFNLGVWLPVFFIIAGSYATPKLIYPIFLFGVLIVMPLMSTSTRRGIEGIREIQSIGGEGQSIFEIKDMDVLDTAAYTFDYAKRHGFANGDCTLCTAFFFIPRAIWTSKPEVAGLAVGEDIVYMAGAGTPNLSYFIGAEFYLDFGWVGVLICPFILGVLYKKLPKPDISVANVSVFNSLLIACLPILMRGPTGAVAGLFLGFIAALTVYIVILWGLGFRLLYSRTCN